MSSLNSGRKDSISILQLPKDVRHKRLSRSISKSMVSLHNSNHNNNNTSSSESSANNSIKDQKSTEQLCFGRARKKKLYLDDFHRAPSLNAEEQHLMVPEVKQRRRSSGESALGTLIKQTLKVTSQSMGLKLANSKEKLNEVAFCPIDEDVKRHFSRSSSSVSTLIRFPSSDTYMAPLQCHAETRSATCLNNCNEAQLDSSISTSARNTSQSDPASQTQNELNYLRRSEQRSIKTQISEASLQRKGSSCALDRDCNLNTAKNEPQMAASTTATIAPIGGSDKKEKKHKEVSSSRIKKFHRHFPQICKDENLINYFSCALVSDILLQGHLYITDKHFAFYSNVFGYITKLVIPTSSVTRVSKEKTAKIIPNAVGVATIDERHVFGSFISREAAFRLMCSVCPKMMPAEILPQPSQPTDVEHFEEYSIEDDSSCSISGNESLPLLLDRNSRNQTPEAVLFKRSVTKSNSNVKDIIKNAKINAGASKITATPTKIGEGSEETIVKTPILIIAGSASSSTNSTPSSSPPTIIAHTSLNANKNSPTHRLQSKAQTLANKFMLKFPTEVHIVYLGLLLTLVLAILSIFLLYRIMDIESKAIIYHSTMNFNEGAIDDEGILTEALRWQKELRKKSAQEAQQILDTNLEQIGKVRRSLETLSMLINNRGMVSVTANNEEHD